MKGKKRNIKLLSAVWIIAPSLYSTLVLILHLLRNMA